MMVVCGLMTNTSTRSGPMPTGKSVWRGHGAETDLATGAIGGPLTRAGKPENAERHAARRLLCAIYPHAGHLSVHRHTADHGHAFTRVTQFLGSAKKGPRHGMNRVP
jgi:hypothetical protein